MRRRWRNGSGGTAVVEIEEPGEGGADREFLKYTFYKVQPEWRRLPDDAKKKSRAEFVRLLHEFEDDVTFRCYALQGIRADADFMTWAIDPRLGTFVEMARRIFSTELGRYLETT